MKRVIYFVLVFICVGCAKSDVKEYVRNTYSGYQVKEMDVLDTIFLRDKYRYDSLKLTKHRFDIMLNIHSSEVLEQNFVVSRESNDEYVLEQIRYNKIRWTNELQLVDSQLNALRDSDYNTNKKIAVVYKALIVSDDNRWLLFLCRKSDGTITRVYPTKLDPPFTWNYYYSGQNVLEAPIK